MVDKSDPSDNHGEQEAQEKQGDHKTNAEFQHERFKHQKRKAKQEQKGTNNT